jgi:hypothetical protein
MKAILLVPLFYLVTVSFALGSAEQPARADEPAARTQTNQSGNSNIEVENWVKPEPGWFYVLDPQLDTGAQGGASGWSIPKAAKVMGSIRTGDNTDFALSPDGTRLISRLHKR